MDTKDSTPRDPYLMQEAANHLTALGYSVIPVNGNKEPTVSTWKPFQGKIADAFLINEMFLKNTFGVAIITGGVSGNVEMLDEDCKYDLTGEMHNEFVSRLEEEAPGLYGKLFIEITVNHGFHYCYRCDVIEGSLKLASRPATEEEQKLNPKERQKGLYETKGEGGYFVCAPTKGYEVIQGSFDNIPVISPDERDILHSVARSFDECPKTFEHAKTKEEKNFSGLSPFADYDRKADVVALLEKHGWTITYTKGPKTFLKRPGDTKAKQSGNFDSDKNWFSVFSTSTEFEPQKAYKPYAVYAMLEHGGDFSKASKQLYEDGYGDRRAETSIVQDKFLKRSFPNANIDPDFDVSEVIINSVDLLKMDVEENRYLFNPLIPRIGTGVLAGSPDTGKSQFARQFCIAVATGVPHFLDYSISAIHGRALYIATEDDSHNTSFLMKNQLKGLSQSETENLSFIFADTLAHEEILLALDSHLTKTPCDLVVVDSFGDIFQGSDTNNTTSMRKNVRYFSYMAKKHKCFVLFVHHITKGSYHETPHQKNVSGGGGLTQKVRFVWQLTRGEGLTRYLTVTKGNYCPSEYKENSWVLMFSETDFLFTNTSQKIPTDTINLDGGKNKDDKTSKLVALADEIFQGESIPFKTFCERYENITNKSHATASRHHAAMKKLEIIIKDEETGYWKLNDTVSTIENPESPEETPPF